MTAEKRLISKVLAPHVRGCIALKHTKERFWGTPWAYLKEAEYRDRIGRRSRHGTRWWLVGCNSPDCTALITVCETSILEALPNGRS